MVTRWLIRLYRCCSTASRGACRSRRRLLAPAEQRPHQPQHPHEEVHQAAAEAEHQVLTEGERLIMGSKRLNLVLSTSGTIFSAKTVAASLTAKMSGLPASTSVAKIRPLTGLSEKDS